jgi:hypothetical protein
LKECTLFFRECIDCGACERCPIYDRVCINCFECLDREINDIADYATIEIEAIETPEGLVTKAVNRPEA